VIDRVIELPLACVNNVDQCRFVTLSKLSKPN